MKSHTGPHIPASSPVAVAGKYHDLAMELADHILARKRGREQGDPLQHARAAAELEELALREAEAAGFKDPLSLVTLASSAGFLHIDAGNPERARALATAYHEMAEQLGNIPYTRIREVLRLTEPR